MATEKLLQRIRDRHYQDAGGYRAAMSDAEIQDVQAQAMRVETTKLVSEIRRAVMAHITPGEDIDDFTLQSDIKAEISKRNLAAQGGFVDEEELLREIKYEMRGYGIIQPFLDDPSVSEIMINGPGPGNILLEQGGMIRKVQEVFYTSAKEIDHLAYRVLGPLGRKVDNKTPYANGWITVQDRKGTILNHRVHAIIPPIATNGPYITIRKHREPLTMAELIENGTICEEALDYLRACVAAGLSCVISGGTSSGKTNTLNVLLSFIPHTQRIVVIQDVSELQVNHPNAPELLTRDKNMEDVGMVAYESLVEESLRMRIDWIILGEARGREAYGIDNAANTGHHVLFSLHSNGPRETMSRLETMIMKHPDAPPYRAIQRSIAQNMDMIVHQERLVGSDGRTRRRVVNITEVMGMGKGEHAERVYLNDQFTYDRDRDCLVKKKAPGYYDRLLKTGLPVPKFD